MVSRRKGGIFRALRSLAVEIELAKRPFKNLNV
jgi:hypothetical protein